MMLNRFCSSVIEGLECRRLLAVTPAAADQMVVVDQSTGDLALIDTRGAKTPITTGLKQVADPCLSPDRKTIAFDAIIGANNHANTEIFTISVNGSVLMRLTKNSIFDSEPHFSPDGKKIVFSSGDGDAANILVVNADGTEEKTLTSNSYGEFNPSFSPDGSEILFDSDVNGTGTRQIYTMDATTGGNLTQLTTKLGDSNENASYSPDGTHITFTSEEGNGFRDVWIMNADGSSPTQLTHVGSDASGAGSPTFSPDGSSIAFGYGSVGGNFLELIDSTGGSPIQIGTSGLVDPSWASVPQFSSLMGFTVTVTGTSSADHISIVDDENSGNLEVTLNGKTETYNDALVQYVDVFCGAGNDTLDASQAPENIYADGGSGNDNLIGGESNDTLTSGAGKNTLYGGDGDDRLNGSGGHDYISGDAGNDRIYGNGGDDILLGGDGTDRIWGGDGNDQISGGNGPDKLYGQAGNDLLQGQNGNDFLDGSPGTDTLNGGNNTDTAYAPPGTTLIHIELET